MISAASLMRRKERRLRMEESFHDDLSAVFAANFSGRENGAKNGTTLPEIYLSFFWKDWYVVNLYSRVQRLVFITLIFIGLFFLFFFRRFLSPRLK